MTLKIIPSASNAFDVEIYRFSGKAFDHVGTLSFHSNSNGEVIVSAMAADNRSNADVLVENMPVLKGTSLKKVQDFMLKLSIVQAKETTKK